MSSTKAAVPVGESRQARGIAGDSSGRRLAQDPDQIFRLRIKAGLTQSQLAAKAGVVKSTVSRLERGLVSAEPGTLHALAGALGCPIEELMPRATSGRWRSRG